MNPVAEPASHRADAVEVGTIVLPEPVREMPPREMPTREREIDEASRMPAIHDPSGRRRVSWLIAAAILAVLTALTWWLL